MRPRPMRCYEYPHVQLIDDLRYGFYLAKTKNILRNSMRIQLKIREGWAVQGFGITFKYWSNQKTRALKSQEIILKRS